MAEFYSHLVDLGKDAGKKLKQGGIAIIKKVGSGIPIHLAEENHKKAMSAYKRKKGFKLKLTPEEIAQNESESGSGFFQTLNKLGVSKKQFMKGAKQAAKIAAPLVKDIAKPVGAALGTAAVTAIGNPELAVVAAPLGAALANEGSNQLTKFAGSGFRVAGERYGYGFDPSLTAFPSGFNTGLSPSHATFWSPPMRVRGNGFDVVH